MTSVYVASSWRNLRQPDIVSILRGTGHEVYDFRNPKPGNSGFRWLSIDPEWQSWRPDQYVAALQHPIAQEGFALDMDALRACDACLLVLPSGRSSHLELGWAIGAGKATGIMLSNDEPELMNLMADRLFLHINEVLDWLEKVS